MRRAQTALEYLFMMSVAIMVLIILYRVHPRSTSGDTENLGAAVVNATSNLTDQVKEAYDNL